MAASSARATPRGAPAIGIDLGTTYSAVAVFRRGRAEIIESVDDGVGDRTTPSYVAYATEAADSGSRSVVYIGKAARELVTDMPANILFDSKRLLGRRFNDPEVQQDIRNWPFQVMNDGGCPKYEITENGLTKMVSAEEVSAKVLQVMKKTAADRLGVENEITKAVVTVPAYFNDSQRQATINAGRLAGLEVLGILNEPTAAAIAFGFGKSKNATILIFDLGGGTFDVSVLKVQGDRFESLAHGGDTHLGGQDLDNCLLDYVINDIRSTLGVDVREDAEMLRDSRIACELLKRKLSNLPQDQITINLNRHGKVYKKAITRAKFEELVAPLLQKTIKKLPDILTEAKVAKEDIDDVVLVGGSTRIPKLRAMLRGFFDGKELNKSVNPDEAVAQGAAIHAASLTGQDGAKQMIKLKEVSSLSLGVATSNGLVAFLIRRNTPLPHKATRTFITANDDQEEAEIKVCQGERAKWEDNHILGEMTLHVPARAKGKVDIDTTFLLDEGGILTVTAQEKATGEKVEAVIECESRLSEREIQNIVAKAKECIDEDKEAKERVRQERFALKV